MSAVSFRGSFVVLDEVMAGVLQWAAATRAAWQELFTLMLWARPQSKLPTPPSLNYFLKRGRDISRASFLLRLSLRIILRDKATGLTLPLLLSLRAPDRRNGRHQPRCR